MINLKDYIVFLGFILMLALFLLQKLRARSRKKKKIMENKMKREERRKKRKVK